MTTLQWILLGKLSFYVGLGLFLLNAIRIAFIYFGNKKHNEKNIDA